MMMINGKPYSGVAGDVIEADGLTVTVLPCRPYIQDQLIQRTNEVVTSAVCTIMCDGQRYDVAAIYDAVQGKCHVSTFGLAAPVEVLNAAESWIKDLHTKNVGESPTKEIS